MDTDRLWVIFSWCTLVACLIAWPISSLTFAKHEPQTILGLSWAAMIIAALGNVLSARVNRRVGKNNED